MPGRNAGGPQQQAANDFTDRRRPFLSSVCVDQRTHDCADIALARTAWHAVAPGLDPLRLVFLDDVAFPEMRSRSESD